MLEGFKPTFSDSPTALGATEAKGDPNCPSPSSANSMESGVLVPTSSFDLSDDVNASRTDPAGERGSEFSGYRRSAGLVDSTGLLNSKGPFGSDGVLGFSESHGSTGSSEVGSLVRASVGLSIPGIQSVTGMTAASGKL